MYTYAFVYVNKYIHMCMIVFLYTHVHLILPEVGNLKKI